jgi:hypothetical protein
MSYHPESNSDNSFQIILLTWLIQLGIWISDSCSEMTIDGIYLFLYNSAKLLALVASIWASFRVGKSNKMKNEK